jgi:hypothetical protein
MATYNKEIKKAAMIKTGYSSKKTIINSAFSKNKENAATIKKSRSHMKADMAKVIVKVELYHKVYKDLEVIISGVNKTNGKLRIKKIIDDVINKHIPSSMINKFSSIKKKLDELSKLTDLDIYNLKEKIIVAAKNNIYNNIMEKAEKIYKTNFFRIAKSDVKQPLSPGDIAKVLRNKDSVKNLNSFTSKLESAANIVNKLDRVIAISNTAIKVFDSYAEGKKLLDQSNNLQTSKDYKEYYYKVAQEASKMASTLKSFSSKLPLGMRDYYEFIFTVAENTDKMAKVVYDYTTKLETVMAELDKVSNNIGINHASELQKDTRKNKQAPGEWIFN